MPEAEYPAGALIDVFQYLGSLKHGVWKRMERAVNRCKYTSIVLNKQFIHDFNLFAFVQALSILIQTRHILT